MTTINDLCVTSSVSADDKIPLWSNANGVTRALPISVLDGRYLTQDDISQLLASAAVETFVAGDGIVPNTFVPGTTVALGLANAYSSGTNIEVFFDSAFQGPDQYTLVNKTLTFISPIPVGVQSVYVRGGAVRVIGAPSDGTVYDSALAAGSKLISHNNNLNMLTDPPYNGIGNGIADNTAAITAAQNVGPTIVPNGTFKTSSIASGALRGPFYGDGQIQDSGGNKRGKIFNSITSRPAVGSFNSIETAFNGDLSHQPIAIEHRISGAGTLGAPAVGGYVETPETSAYQAWMLNTSGAVNGNGLGAGRTAAMLHFVAVQQYGQADAHAYNVNAFIGSNNPSATNINAVPAACLFTGQVSAGVDGCYLNPMELNCVDNGHDVAGVGYVSNSFRDNATGALGAWWYGFRQQSFGSVPVDVAFSATGKHKFGLDLSYCDFGVNNSAIALKADQKIYGNVSPTDPTGRYPSVTADFFSYSSATGGWVFSVGGNPALQITGAQVTSPFAIQSNVAFKVSGSQVVGAQIAGYGTPTGPSRISSFPGATATLTQTSQMLAALIVDLKTHGLIGT